MVIYFCMLIIEKDCMDIWSFSLFSDYFYFAIGNDGC